MGQSTGLIIAVAGGIAAGIIAIIILICYKRWTKRQTVFNKPGWAPIRKRQHRISHPPIPKPNFRTSSITVGDGGMRRAQDYVERPAKNLSNPDTPVAKHRTSVPEIKEPQLLQHRPLTEHSSLGVDQPSRRVSLPTPSIGVSLVPLSKTESLPPSSKLTAESDLQSIGLSPHSSPRTGRRFSIGLAMTQGTYDPLVGPDALSGSTSPGYSAESLVSLTSNSSPLPSPDELDNSSTLGQIQFRIEPYNSSTEMVRFHLIQGMNFQSKDFGGTSDPFVVTHLVDLSCVSSSGNVVLETADSFTSKTHMRTLDPLFNEKFDFPCPTLGELSKKGLLLLAYDFDRFSRNDLIGHIWFPLNDIDLMGTTTVWKPILPGLRISSEPLSARGSLQLSLSYSRSNGRITGFVLKARQLRRQCNPYVKIDLIHLGARIGKMKTPTQKYTHEPVFNESFAFELDKNQKIENCGLVFAVMDRDILRSSILGCASIGPGGQESGQKHWENMIGLNGRQAVMWHDLVRARRKTPRPESKSPNAQRAPPEDD